MDNLSLEDRKKNMRNIRSTGTTPELRVMRELKRRKVYFATYVKTLIGKPDIVFRKKKIAVFIDSDFWHMHPTRFIMPNSNLEYWRPKIERNKRRDKEVNRQLRKTGWRVLRIWEFDVKKNTDRVIKRILRAIERLDANEDL